MDGRWVLPVVGAAWVLASCAGRPLLGATPPSRIDDAVELAALLPDDVERCVVTRPGLVPERRRALVKLHSQAEPAAWETELGIVAYASALAEGEGGRQVRRSYYRLASPVDAELVRRALGIRWLDEPCDGEPCRKPTARWLDERTLEVARYEWPRRRLPVSTASCVQLARERPTAIEVSSRITRALGTVHLIRPAYERAAMRADRSALVSLRELDFEDVVEARILEAQIAQGRWIDAALVPLVPARQHVEREGARVTVLESRSWDELELAVEDERLARQAMALAAARREPSPISRVRIDDLASVRHQIRLRRAELDRLAPGARATAAADLAELLRRAWRAHPAELSFAHALARLELDLRRDAAAARALAEEVLARGLGDVRAWRALLREALSREAPDELARALATDGIAETPADAARAAADLAALAQLGVPYEWAEGAWSTSRELLRGRAPLRPADARVPFEGLLGALVGWARLENRAHHVTVQIAIRSPAPGEVGAIGESRPEIIVVRAPEAGMVHVAALPSPDLVALRRLGASLAPVLPPGPLDVVIALRDPGGGPLSTLRASGTLAGGAMHVDRVSAELERVPWPLFTRYLARPLEELDTALFPPPTLTVRAESAELAAALRRSAERSYPGACTAAGPVLRCRRPGRPDELGDLLLELFSARVRLDGAAP